MDIPKPEKKNIIKDVRNRFSLEKLKKETINITIKDIKNIFRLEKENEEIKNRTLRGIRNAFRRENKTKAIKDRILRDISILFENEEEENYYKPVRVSNFWSNKYIKYESNGNTNKTLSVEEYL